MNGAATIAGAIAIMWLFADLTWFRTPAEPKVPVSAARTGLLALAVQREGRSLRVTWDRNADQVRNGHHATLQIIDGTHHTQLELNAAEVSAGKLIYWPDTGTVSFRLSVGAAVATASMNEAPVVAAQQTVALRTNELVQDTSGKKPSPFESPRRHRKLMTVATTVPEAPVSVRPQASPAAKPSGSFLGRLAHKIPFMRRFQKSGHRPNVSSD
jgi:hypothetical protein